MASSDSLRDLAVRFFDAIERGDIETVREIYAPEVAIWHNTDGQTSTREENVEVLRGFVHRIPQRRYQERRCDVFPGGFLHQHVLAGVRRDGMRLRLPACIVCRVVDGHITRLDEYFDGAALADWMVET